MGKIRRFLGILASLTFVLFSVGAAVAAGYSCPESRVYTSCVENYYLSEIGVAENECLACPDFSTSPADNTTTQCTCSSTRASNIVDGEFVTSVTTGESCKYKYQIDFSCGDTGVQIGELPAAVKLLEGQSTTSNATPVGVCKNDGYHVRALEFDGERYWTQHSNCFAPSWTSIPMTITADTTHGTEKHCTVTPTWVPNTVYMKYTSGMGNIVKTTCTYDNNYTLLSALPAPGYTFKEWVLPNGAKLAAGTLIPCNYAVLGSYGGYQVRSDDTYVLNDGTTVDTEDELVNFAVELTPVFEPITYTITYSAGDAGSATQTELVAFNSDFTAKPANTFTYAGRTFAGWLGSDGNTYDAGQTYKYSYAANLTLTAQWTVNEYAISYELNGGTDATSGMPTTYTYDSGATISGVPTRNGYTFNGWCTTEALTAGTCSFTQTIAPQSTGAKKFYARWCQNCMTPENGMCELNATNAGTCAYETDCTPGYAESGAGTATPTCSANTYNVYYKDSVTMGDIDGMVPTTYKVGVGATVSAIPTKAGYVFTGWCDNSATSVNCAMVRTIDTTTYGDKTFYAAWTACKSCITVPNGTCQMTVADNKCVYATTCNDGYTHKTGTENTNAPECLGNIITLNWNENGGTEVTSGTCTYGGSIALPSTPSYSGYTFNGWEIDGQYYKAGATITGGCTYSVLGVYAGESDVVSAAWCENCATVANGSCSLNATKNLGQCAYSTACNSGYTIANAGTANPICNANVFNVTYNGGENDGGNAPSQPTTCNYGETCVAPENTYTKTDYKFAGWTCTGGGASCDGDVVQPGADISKAATASGATITLTATWIMNAACIPGFYYDGSDYVECEEGYYCTGEGTVTEGQVSCAKTACDVAYPNSESGAKSEGECYITTTTTCVDGGKDYCATMWNGSSCTYSTGRQIEAVVYANDPDTAVAPPWAEETGLYCVVTKVSCSSAKGHYYTIPNDFVNGQCASCSSATSGEYPKSATLGKYAATSDYGIEACYKEVSVPCVAPVCPLADRGDCDYNPSTTFPRGRLYYGTSEPWLSSGSATCPSSTDDSLPADWSCFDGYYKNYDYATPSLATPEELCLPIITTITLDDGDGVGGVGTIYMEYKNGWSLTDFGSVVTNVAVPSRDGYTFLGYFASETSDDQYIDKNGTIAVEPTLLEDATWYARWYANETSCEMGKYYNGTEHVACQENWYCDGLGSVSVTETGCYQACPDGYTSASGQDAKTDCFMTCDAGQYWTGTECANAESGFYGYSDETKKYYGSAAEGPNACPTGADGSDRERDGVTDCYVECESVKDEAIENGTISTHELQQYYQTSGEYSACTYDVVCDDDRYAPTVTPALRDEAACQIKDPSLCRAGYYCPGNGQETRCPEDKNGTNGTTDGGKTAVTDCYIDYTPYDGNNNPWAESNRGFKNGTGAARCTYTVSTQNYTSCNLIEVYTCDAGYYYNNDGLQCTAVNNGWYSADGEVAATECPAGWTGSKADPLRDTFEDCYQTCEIDIEHSELITPQEERVYAVSSNEYAACSYDVVCDTGYDAVNNMSAAPTCEATTYKVILNKNGGTGGPADSVDCVFDSGVCELPMVTGMTRDGYTAEAKWCRTSNGGGTCYGAGSTVTTNISSDGRDIELYAVWTPNVYKVVLDDNTATSAAAPNTVYLKYNTGWYMDAAATKSIKSLTTMPDKNGTAYALTGYYTTADATGGVQVISGDGTFIETASALTITTQDNAKIYARWSAQTTQCDAGEYYTGVDDVCAPCTEGHYCLAETYGVTTDGVAKGLHQCPNEGMSAAGAKSSAECYKEGLTYAPENGHGTGTQACFYDNEDGDGYIVDCYDQDIDLCDAGYYLENDTDILCSAVGRGKYSPANDLVAYNCPTVEVNGQSVVGTTAENMLTASQPTQCYAQVAYTAIFGSGTQHCYYYEAEKTYKVNTNCFDKYINSCEAGYYRETEESVDCAPAPVGKYSDEGDIDSYDCPNNGTTAGAGEGKHIGLCYLEGQPYNDAQHGKGTQRCYYTSGTGSTAEYTSACDTIKMTECDAGYYYDTQILKTDCIVVGFGWYSPAKAIERTACVDGGLTLTQTSSKATECYLENVDCVLNNGVGVHTCNYEDASADYTNCTACAVTRCADGYYSTSSGACEICPAGNVCDPDADADGDGTPDNGAQTCEELTGGTHNMSAAGISNVDECYTNCVIGENVAEVAGQDFYGLEDTCEIVKCEPGYYEIDGQCVKCPAGSVCNPDADTDGDGNADGQPQTCEELTGGTHPLSVAGAADASQCYHECEEYPLKGGTAIPVDTEVFYPNECEFTGKSNTGNPCEIRDDKCIETSCNYNFELIDGTCEPCNRDKALTYKKEGNCVVETCEIGYHPNGQQCEFDIVECTAPNAEQAQQVWNKDKNAFSECLIMECAEGYHLAENVCQLDEQTCEVEHGIGLRRWNHTAKAWGECIATECDPGYTNDSRLTNDLSGQCGPCNNMYGAFGERVASSYIRECEIASCMYEGERFHLENNECILICEEREDETGTQYWDASRKKCIRTCEAGYMSW